MKCNTVDWEGPAVGQRSWPWAITSMAWMILTLAMSDTSHDRVVLICLGAVLFVCIEGTYFMRASFGHSSRWLAGWLPSMLFLIVNLAVIAVCNRLVGLRFFVPLMLAVYCGVFAHWSGRRRRRMVSISRENTDLV